MRSFRIKCSPKVYSMAISLPSPKCTHLIQEENGNEPTIKHKFIASFHKFIKKFAPDFSDQGILSTSAHLVYPANHVSNLTVREKLAGSVDGQYSMLGCR